MISRPPCFKPNYHACQSCPVAAFCENAKPAPPAPPRYEGSVVTPPVGYWGGRVL